ncbi:MAG: PQQ-like beta-propeller repeat protein [Verrucomicrobia subdivision 3 bacterium]|nr:PQQ-like beta-propeller repeat protein [Limisphaerales bacterium]
MNNPSTSSFRCGLAVFAAWLSAAPPARSAGIPDQVLTNFWYTDGYVYAVAETNGVVYIGGTFHYVGPETGPNAFLDPATGARDDSFPPVNGQIRTAVADGAGGWFIGGEFSMVGEEPRFGLAHILADKSVDPSWAPTAFPGTVSSIVLAGGTLYVAGSFFSLGDQPRSSIGAINAATGAVTPWNPAPTGFFVQMNSMTALGNTIYVAGTFNNIGGQARTNLAAIDATTGNALAAWNPFPNAAPLVLLASGGTVYAGGNFFRISGQNRTNFAALDATTGNLLPGPNAVGGAVNGFGLSGNTLYLGGFFSSLGGVSRAGLGAIDITSGNVTSWNPGSGVVGNLTPSVFSIGIAGNTVYVGGTFTLVGGEPRLRIAALDGTSGNALPGFNPGANNVVRQVIPVGTRVIASGDFSSIDGVKRNNIAALNALTGAATAWNPGSQFGGGVNSIAVSSSAIYVGGTFTNMGGQIRHGLAALDPATGAATSWNPAPAPAPNSVNSFSALLLSGTTLYAAGSAINAGRTNAAAFDTVSGAVTAWNPFPNSLVNTLVLGNGVIYAGGAFTRIGGIQMSNLAALDPITGTATPWNPRVDRQVYALTVHGNTVYAGGLFRRIGGISRTNFAAVDVITGNAVDFPNPEYSFAGGGVYAVALLGTNSLLVGGASFDDVGGFLGAKLLELELATGNRTDWAPAPERVGAPSGSDFVRAITVGTDKIYIGTDLPGGFVAYAQPGAPPPPPRLTMPMANGGSFQFRLLGEDGIAYTVEGSDDLGFWQFIDMVTPVDGFIDVTDPNASSFNQRIYRAYAP